MSFFHAYLLGGLSLIAVPVLVHLITRDKPKQLRFPAFRFLQQKYQTNRRKLRVHHLLLLLLRMLLIAALVFALARPRLHSNLPSWIGGNQPLVVALLFDTSPSMEYERGGVTRLDDARQRALELLEELPDGSKVVLLDSSERGGEFTTREAVRDRLKALEIRPSNGPVSRLMAQAFKMLAEEDGSAEGASEPPPRYLYVFSDRTRAAWDSADVRNLKAPDGVGMMFVDVGVDKPTDLAIEQLMVDPPAVAPGGKVYVRAVVRATGEKADRNFTCQLDNDPRLQTRNVKLDEGTRQIVTFEFTAAQAGNARDGGLASGPHQVMVRIEGTDRLPFNNVRHGTFIVRPGRKVLTVVDSVDENNPPPWPLALEVMGFSSTVKTARDAEALSSFNDFDLVCLHQLSDPSKLWKPLSAYMDRGGRLIVIPGGDVQTESYNDRGKLGSLLPAKLERPKSAPSAEGLTWDWSLSNPAPLMAPFLRWRREQGDVEFNKPNGQPKVYRYWEVTPLERVATIASCVLDGKTNPPMILERVVGQGRVLLFTTKLDAKFEKITFEKGEGIYPWTNYWSNSFGLVLVDKACRYLVGDSIAADYNYVCGQTVAVALPREGGDKYLLRGPGMPPQGTPLSVPDPAPEEKSRDRFLPISRAVLPGNYLVYSVRNERQDVLDGFSMDVRPDESLLTPRVPKEEIEELFGKDSVLDVEHGVSLREAISKKPQPVELLPYLMLALLIFLAVENVLANRSREKKPAATAPPPPENVEEKVKTSWRPFLLVLLWAALGVGIGAALGILRGSTGNVAASAVVTGLFGLSHGLLGLARFGPRDAAILGGLLGSMAGVLGGWLIPSEGVGVFSVVLGMLAGAALLAADGWVMALRTAPKS